MKYPVDWTDEDYRSAMRQFEQLREERQIEKKRHKEKDEDLETRIWILLEDIEGYQNRVYPLGKGA